MSKYKKNYVKCCYICSPYRGNAFERIRNRRYARYLTAKAIKMGYAPITPHLYIAQVLNDKIPEERKQGLEVGLKLLRPCKYILIGRKYGISEGMKAEIKEARAAGKIIITIGGRK